MKDTRKWAIWRIVSLTKDSGSIRYSIGITDCIHIYSKYIIYSYRATYISSFACAYTCVYCADSSPSNMCMMSNDIAWHAYTTWYYMVSKRPYHVLSGKLIWWHFWRSHPAEEKWRFSLDGLWDVTDPITFVQICEMPREKGLHILQYRSTSTAFDAGPQIDFRVAPKWWVLSQGPASFSEWSTAR